MLKKIESLKLNYRTVPKKQSSCVDVVMMFSNKEFKSLLGDIFEYDIEVIAFANLNNNHLCEKYFINNQYPDRKWIKDKTANVYIGIVPEEDGIAISLSKESYDVKQIISKIKEVF